MRKIEKTDAPESLIRFKRNNRNARYANLTEVERNDIRTKCAEEQFYLCGYCCKRVSGSSIDTVNEHIEPRDIAPDKDLDFSNIIASCKTRQQCDNAHGSARLQLTPLMSECETELSFSISGRVRGNTQRAKALIETVNLGDHEKNNKSLVQQRKKLSDALLYANGVDPEEGLDDEELLKLVIEDIETSRDGKLQPFAPVVINILNGWLAN